jgi:hypothetical protein
MENNFNQDEKQELKERAKRKLQQMSTVEKADCVRKEKKRTYWWLGISLFCCIAWISAIFTNLNAPSDTSNNPIGALVIATIVGATISIFMIIKLFKKDEQIALIRINREIKKEIKVEIERKKIQTVVGDDFVVSKTVPILASGWETIKLIVDNEHKQFIYLSGKYQSKKYKFSDIINYEIYENGHSKVKGRAGSALIGGAFFGLGGLIVGSSMSRNINEKCNQLKLIIRLNDFDCPQIMITYVDNVDWDKNGWTYRNMKENLQSVCSMLEFMLNEKSLEQSSTAKQEELSAKKSNKEQLQELKEMLDDGLITQEDFEQKKKQLLNL